MTTSTPEKQDGLKALQDAIDKIEETINKMGGVFKVQMAVSKFTLFVILREYFLCFVFSFFSYKIA